MKIRTVIIEDEPLAREGMENYVRQISFLSLAGSFDDPISANETVSREADLLFLDIHTPGISGIDYLKGLAHPPLVIITTAYPAFALQGYELNVLDYLVKPIAFDRFLKSVNKAHDYMRLKQESTGATSKEDYIFIKADSKLEKVQLEDILFIEGRENYIRIQTTAQVYMTLLPMKNIEQALPADRFLRVHKSYIISIDKIEAIEGNQLKIKAFQVPISRNLKEEVLKKIVNRRLLR